MNWADMKQEIAKFSGRLEEMIKSLGEVGLVRIDKKVDKINEDVEFIDATVDGLQIVLDHKIKEDQLEIEFIYTKIYIK